MRLTFKSILTVVILFGFMEGLDLAATLLTDPSDPAVLVGVLTLLTVVILSGRLLYILWSREIRALLSL